MLMHMLSGEATERDAAELVAWRMQSRAHEEAFRSAVRLRRLIQGAEPVGRTVPTHAYAVQEEGNILPFAQRRRVPVSRRGFMGGALAASIAGGLLVAGRSLDMVPAVSEWQADYRTSTGERRTVRLAQGASVELNTRTSIDLRRDLTMPAVELLDGEALMVSPAGGEVALVAANGTSVGRSARFNARRMGDAICITCLAGIVEVSVTDARQILSANDQLSYDSRGIGNIIRNIDTATVTAWKAGTLIFRDMPMRSVISEINRYRPGRVFLANAALGNRSLSGTYYLDRLDDFFDQAQLGLGAKITRLPGNVVILS